MESLRKWVQFLCFFLTNGYWNFPFTQSIYKGPLKVICSPGLNCYSCPAATTYCPIGSLQQLLGGIRLALETGHFYIGFYVIGTMGLIGASVGRLICAWICPFGLLQELLHKIPSTKFDIWPVLKYAKYLLLAFLVVLLPLFAIDSFGNGEPWFCKYFCPAGTLEAGIPMILLQPDLQDKLGGLFLLKISILVFFLIWSVIASRPFCRTACPLGAFYGLFSKVKLVKLAVDQKRCTDCEACHAVCPMGVKVNESVNDTECITCLACTKACHLNAVSIEIGGVSISGKRKLNPGES
ncbi:MAG: 4Fe-4S binding protein [Desulfobacterales bacterium]|nr:4Fe-4S binding protein [Desulfobacterales bacterium]